MFLYRGVAQHQESMNGWFYSPSIEFARQFTQSGRYEEIVKLEIDPAKIYRPDPLPYGGDPEETERARQEAAQKGFSAFYVDEGPREPESVLVMKRAIYRREARIVGRCTAPVESAQRFLQAF